MKKWLKDNWIYNTIVLVLLATIIFLVIFMFTTRNNKPSYYDNKVATYEVENANYSKGQIIFIGDSITDLYHLDTYYSDLDLAVYNRGIGGDTTDGVINRLKVSLYDLEPSKIVLMIGTNDLNGGKSNDYIVENYERILNSIKENLPTTEVYCMSITSYHDALAEYINVEQNVERVIQINTRIKTLVESKGYIYLDLFSLTVDANNKLKTEYSDDGIHLNHAGFLVWTGLVKPYLN